MTGHRSVEGSKDWGQTLAPILGCLRLFDGLTREELEDASTQISWLCIPGGMSLVQEGDSGDALFLIRSGAFGIVTTKEDGREYISTKISAGGTVGELSLVTGTLRTATLTALRDSELICVTRTAFDDISKRHPRVLRNLLDIMAGRLTRTIKYQRPPYHVRNCCLIPATQNGSDAAYDDLIDRLEQAFAEAGTSAVIHKEQEAPTFSADEIGNDQTQSFSLYQAKMDDSRWSRHCIRQADRILLLVPDDARYKPSALLNRLQEDQRDRVELVFLRSRHSRPADTLETWLTHFGGPFHHHIRQDNQADTQRLARHLSGQALGLVLAGGGARGFAHLGVLRALRELGIVFDVIGGTSMGAVIGAGIAHEWSDDELEDRMREAFVKSDPLSDYTVPRIALMRGQRVTGLLKDTFGDLRIQDLWIKYFCVSSDLTAGTSCVHHDGEVWRALRASISIPGILPPVERNGHVLVDGAVINNFPADEMASLERGPIIGVDVGGDHSLKLDDAGNERSTWRTMDQVQRNDPGIINVLMRAGTVNSEAQTARSRRLVDQYFAPPVGDIGLRDWRSLDQAIEIGYEYVQKMQRQNPGGLAAFL